MMGVLVVGSAGCALKFSKRSPWDIQQIQALSERLEQFRTLAQLKSDEADRLRQAKALLDQRLSSEIANQNVTVGFDERGLVVRVVDRVLFDSGKAELRPAARQILARVTQVLREQLADQPISIEGHTDNEPIVRSKWKDNWDLSLARARSVLHYLVKDEGLEPRRVSAAGYGEYHPLASNDTPEGRQHNRRVEIVVLPREKRAASSQSAESGATESVGTTYRK